MAIKKKRSVAELEKHIMGLHKAVTAQNEIIAKFIGSIDARLIDMNKTIQSIQDNKSRIIT